MDEKTVTIEVTGANTIPDEFYRLSEKLPPATTVMWVDEYNCVEYVIKVRGIFRNEVTQ